jgi:hypothetical protein
VHQMSDRSPSERVARDQQQACRYDQPEHAHRW